jgi:hypothetical protein
LQLVQVDGLYMTKEFALAVQTGKDALGVVREQLKETQDFIARNNSLAIVRQQLEAVQDVAAEQSEKPKEPEEPFNLMGLTYNARHVVLEHLVGTRNIRVFLRGGGIPIRLPAVARAGGTKLRRECLLVVLKKCTIEIHSGPGNVALQKWLSNINFTGVGSFCETGFDAITSLTFPYFSRFPYHNPLITKNNDVGLAMACKNLRALMINFHTQELSRIASRHHGNDTAAECALYIRESYQLDGLLNAAKLERLHFRTSAPEYGRNCLVEVVAWFEKGFKERNRKVLIKMGIHGW